jgi:hypothetical protein
MCSHRPGQQEHYDRRRDATGLERPDPSNQCQNCRVTTTHSISRQVFQMRLPTEASRRPQGRKPLFRS